LNNNIARNGQKHCHFVNCAILVDKRDLIY